jgi:hypothetical protein
MSYFTRFLSCTICSGCRDTQVLKRWQLLPVLLCFHGTDNRLALTVAHPLPLLLNFILLFTRLRALNKPYGAPMGDQHKSCLCCSLTVFHHRVAPVSLFFPAVQGFSGLIGVNSLARCLALLQPSCPCESAFSPRGGVFPGLWE